MTARWLSPRGLPAIAALALTCPALAQLPPDDSAAAAPVPLEQPAIAAPADVAPGDASGNAAASEAARRDDRGGRQGRGRGDAAIVAVGSDAVLPAGERADVVVALNGSATSEGDVDESVVAVLGNASTSGNVGENVVAVLGNVRIDGPVDGEVVAVLGDVELGPNARIGNDVVIIGGTLSRDPAARIDGRVENLAASVVAPDLSWFRTWVDHCLLYARPLAFASGIDWAWALGFGFLALYVLLALLFRDATDRCVATFTAHPGQSVLSALLCMLLTPVLFFLLVITIIGIAVVPFFGLALLLAGLFGKMALLAWLGRFGTRRAGDGALGHPAVAVLLGGLVVLGLYTLPVFGFVLFNALGLLGFGVVAYTIVRAWQPAATAAAPTATFGPAPETVHPAPEPAATRLVIDDLSLTRAGFWQRMGALFIDAVLIGIVLALLDGAGALLVLLAAYGAVMWKTKSTTIGGSIFHLKVVRVDGRPIDWSTAIVRALGCFLSLAIGFIGFLWMVFDREGQTWHDKIAGTVVVRVPKGVSLL